MYAGISKEFKERNSDCPETGHFQRIFYAYKEVFKSVLFEYPEDEDFIFIEDDVHLLNFQTHALYTLTLRVGQSSGASMNKTCRQQVRPSLCGVTPELSATVLEARGADRRPCSSQGLW